MFTSNSLNTFHDAVMKNLSPERFEYNGFPSYNIVSLDENSYSIELAVAGYTKDDITIQLLEGNKLSIEGAKVDRLGDKREYLHHGLTNKKFNRTFNLNQNIVVESSSLVDGILEIKLKYVAPESKKARTIKING